MKNQLPFSASIPSTEGAILKASSLGLRYVELTSSRRFPLEGRIESLSNALKSAGVTPATVHGPTGIPSDIGNFDAAARKEAMERHRKDLQHCASLGAECYVIHPGFETYGAKWDDVHKTAEFPRDERTIGRMWETNASSLAELADFAAGLGVKLALEAGPPSIWTPTETLQVVHRVDGRNLGLCVDTGHINVGSKIKPSDAIREAGGLVWALHLQDNKGDGDWHLAPSRGSIDWIEVAKALRDVQYHGKLTLEVGAAGWKEEDIWNAIKEGFSFLTETFDGLLLAE